ncbi:dynein intermediate chain 2, ciliary-like [Dysidea avara]|uniref:dynein intermediate chain 2, ciliary-like n=1 Tax=Dysidea avara TaxID=196820 RepID=UPI00332B8ACD
MIKGKSGKGKPTLKAASVMKRSSQALLSKSIAESKGKLHAFSRGPRRKDDDMGIDEEYDDAWVQPKVVMKPEDQLQLTEQELKEEFTRILTAENPHAPKNLVRYNFKDKSFKHTTTIEQLAIHFALDGNLLHKESDEAQRQLIIQSGDTDDAEEEDEEEGTDEQEEPKGGGDDGATEDDKAKKSGGKEHKLVNQFNFSERASQTQNNPSRERGTMTEPPPRANFSATANQMEIYDAYVEDIAAQEKAKEKKSTKTGGGKEDGKQKKVNSMDLQNDDISRVHKAAKIMERMVNQNTFDDIAQDFRYWNDASDEYKDGKGSLLPLWRFTYNKSKRMAVTAMCWNPLYNDLFAVAHGSYDFGSQTKGMICFHSLKNPTYPEYVYSTDAGVMSIDIHPEHPFLVVVGLYNGSVSVYNLQLKSPNAIYHSTANTGKHTDPVWQVAWQKNDNDNNLNFFSTSSDGRIVSWTIVKNELQYQDMTVLKVPGEVVSGPEGIQTTAIASGTAFDFNTMQDHLYIVGTEDGKLYKCSKAYSTHYLDVYEAHHLAVYTVKWNPFHQNIFASCSADWTVKIWDDTQKDPMFSYDLNCPVGDVVWSPYASTVFAAVTADGKVHVFDLSVNKYEPLAVQSVAQKKNTKLTHVEFNPVHPIIIVGDDRGAVTSFKLSPNLRKALKEKNYSKENEVSKMERLLGFVKEPLIEREIKMMDM